MGSSYNKHKNNQQPIGLNSIIERDTPCPVCGMVLKACTTYLELNKHVETCNKNKTKAKLQELFKELKDTNMEINKIENRKKNSNGEKKKFTSRSNNHLTIVTSTNFNNHPKNNVAILNTNSTSIVSNGVIKAKKERKSTQNIFYVNESGMFMFNQTSTVYNNNTRFKEEDSDPSTFDVNFQNNLLYPQILHEDDYLARYDSMSFEEKVLEFKKKIKNLKIDWREGSCTLELERDKILVQSMQQIGKINLNKELKINFKGEVSHDAGGIIREWYTVIFKEVLSDKAGYFQRADTGEVSYIVNQDLQSTRENLDLFYFIGRIIAKALLENLTINACLNKLIYKLILDEQITLDDLVFIDKPLYHSLKGLKSNASIVDSFGIYFIVQYKRNEILQTDELVPNGSNILVTEHNLEEYIHKRIEHIQQKDKIFINEIKSGLYSVINEKIIKIFNSDEFELLINGQPYIDIYDWQENTVYKGYNRDDVLIHYFWECLKNKSQDELARLLQFCTGSSRVPIGGFSSLESNRGSVSPFCITKCEYSTSKYIRAHTCFNRLDLPNFPSRKHLEDAVGYVINNEILGFGID